MKKLFLMGGTMGVGKTTVGQILKRRLRRSVFLDGDWCWDADPFQVTCETKEMVLDNICFLLKNFLRCSAYENIIFCWVMHRQEIIDEILSRLDIEDCRVFCVSLVCTEDALVLRLQKDVEAGKRTADVIGRSVDRLPLYKQLNTFQVDTSGKDASAVAEEIMELPERIIPHQ